MNRAIAVALCSLAIWLALGAGTAPTFAAQDPTVPAQAPEEPAAIVTMFGSVVVYRTLPTTAILAELADASGPKASGEGISDARGQALVQFLPLPTSRDRYIRPGDTISLVRFGAPPVTIEVPNLLADVDVAAGRIVGSAPPGAQVRVEAETGTGSSVDTTVTAGDDGAWQVAASLAPGAVTGSATYDDPLGWRFVARFADLAADVTLDVTRVRGAGTPGTAVMVHATRPDGTSIQVGTEIVDGTDWSASLPGGIRAGDAFTVTKVGGVAGEVPPLSVADVPEILVEVDPVLDRVSGTGPAGGTVVIEAYALEGDRIEREVGIPATGPDAGTWTLDLAGAVDLAAGWRVRASWIAAPALRVGRLEAIPQALIGVHTSAVRGIAPPGAPVVVTLRSASGALKAAATERADDRAVFDARLGGLMPGVAVAIEPGDVVEVSIVAGDPLIVAVPELVARSDVDADRVTGRSEPGTEVLVRVLSDAAAPVRRVTADAQGDFVADFAGAYDLARPANGIATVAGPSGAAFYTSWAAVRVAAQIGSSALIATGPPGRAYTLRLIAPDGAVLATASGTSYDFPELEDLVLLGSLQGLFIVQFEDIAGAPVDVRAGDTIDVVAGDDAAQLIVPTLEGAVFVEDDILAGRTSPDTRVTVTVESLTGARATAVEVSDEAGRFSHAFAGEHDVQYNDTVQLAVEPDGHAVTSYVAVPGLVLDMDAWQVSGALAPNAELVVTARRGADVLTETRTRSDANGSFAAQLRDAGGEPLALETGDRIDVRVASAGGESVAMLVPELEIQADSATDTITGSVTPGGALVLIVLRQVLDATGFAVGQAWPVIEDDGTWSAVPIPAHDVRPGTTVIAQYRLPSGHMAVRSHIVPLLAIDHGTPNLCGFAAPKGSVSAVLLDEAGTQLATSSASVAASGKYGMVLRDSAGGPVHSAVSDTVRADLTGVEATVLVPRFELEPDWENQTMTGVGPANTLMLGVFPASRCPGILTDLGGFRSATYAFTDEEGRFTSPIPAVAPGEGVELVYETRSGHLVFRQAYRALGRVFIDTDRVTGITDSATDVRLTLLSADGTERARVSTASGPLGDFDARLSGVGGEELRIQAGETLVLEAAGDRAEIVVEELSFDWSPGSAVIGQAPGGREVRLGLRLRDGSQRSIDWRVESDGVFAFGAEDVPPRAAWSWDDVIAVRVVLSTSDGHEIVSQTAGFEAPIGPRGSTLYLPAALRRSPMVGGTASDTRGVRVVGRRPALDRAAGTDGAPVARVAPPGAAAALDLPLDHVSPRATRDEVWGWAAQGQWVRAVAAAYHGRSGAIVR